MSIPLADQGTCVISCITDSHRPTFIRASPLGQDDDGIDNTAVVLPSSDSAHSTKSDDTVSSWRTSDTGITLATSIASSLCKSASAVCSIFSDVARLNRCTTILRWRPNRPWRRTHEDSVDLEAGTSLPLHPLGVYRTYAACDQTGPLCSQKKSYASIRLTFNFGIRSHAYELEYAVFRHWKYVSLLVNAVEEDGMICALIWDESEGLQVMAGDWESRVTPGWQITIFCHDDNDNDDDYDEVHDEKEEPWDSERGYETEWWFKRWKTSVEMKKVGQRKKQRLWLIGALAGSGIVMAFCIISWFESRDNRTIRLD